MRTAFGAAHGLHGSPRLVHDLRDAGWTVNAKTVADSMRRQQLVARRIRRRNGLTRQDRTAPTFPDLLKRDFTAPAPNCRWVGDITEIPTGHGKLDLATVIDLYSRRLLGAATGVHPDAELACRAITMADPLSVQRRVASGGRIGGIPAVCRLPPRGSFRSAVCSTSRGCPARWLRRLARASAGRTSRIGFAILGAGDGFTQLMRYVRQWPDRLWAVEGCNGIGRHVACRLLAAGEQVVDVPPKLSARLRMFDTRQGRKTDPDDAHAIAQVALRMNGLRQVVNDDQHTMLRILADRRRALGEDHTRMVCQLHQLLLELIPGGAKKDLSAAQARVLLASVRPRDLVGKTRKRVAVELVGDLQKIYQRSKALHKEIKRLVVVETGSTLVDLHGIVPSSAARLLVEVGEIHRFPDRNHFASWNGTGPFGRPFR